MSLLDRVPKDAVKNLRWRLRILKAAVGDRELQRDVRQACFEDVLFWFNFCIAEGTLVVTDRGPVPIEDVTRFDLVWDGEEWTSQGGSLCQGHKAVIFAYGIELTPEHKVRTKDGWKPASEGHDREEIRLPDGYREAWHLPRNEAGCVGVPVRVWKRDDSVRKLFEERSHEELRVSGGRESSTWEVGRENLLYVDEYASALQQSEESSLRSIRWPWDSCLYEMGCVREFLGGHGREACWNDDRENQQRRKLRAGELCLGESEGAGEEYLQDESHYQDCQGGFYRNATCPRVRHDTWRSSVQDASRFRRRQTFPSQETRKANVYDLVNCGRRRAFTVLDSDGRPLLVHNCGWLYEPRGLRKVIPFVTWCHQDPVILGMDGAITESEREEKAVDVVLPKSRAQGATYIYLLIFMRRWLRDSRFTAGIVSRNESVVDSKTDSDALLWKYCWCLDMLPEWMLPEGGYERNLSEHTVVNPVKYSTITGHSATQDLGRGGRRTVFALDEFGAVDFIRGEADYAALDATQHVTNCRFLVSTYGADRGAFYEAATNKDYTALRLCLDWKDNPVQSRLAYKQKLDGTVEAKRAEEQAAVEEYVRTHKDLLRRMDRRGHVVVGKVRSPWYDSECSRPGATPRAVAKELDMDPRGAVGKVFDMDVLQRMSDTCCRRATWEGKPSVDEEQGLVLGLVRQEGGVLKCWLEPDIDGKIPQEKYVLGCDISAGGTGNMASNSVVVGINVSTGEQAFEYAVRGMSAIKFARVAVSLARMFHNAYLGWEATGPTGSAFEREVMEMMGYYNVYYREVTQAGRTRLERRPGWWNGGDDDKGMLFEQFSAGMDEGRVIPRSHEMIKECGEYEWTDTGKIVHAPSRIKANTGENRTHGDRCVAAGVANLLYQEVSRDRIDTGKERGQDVKYGTLAWRMERFGKKKYDEDHEVTLAEVVGDRW